MNLDTVLRSMMDRDAVGIGLGRMLIMNKFLKVLKLSYSWCHRDPKVMGHLVNGLVHNTCLEQLNISHRTHEGWADLYQTLTFSMTLKALYIEGHELGMKDLAEMLSWNKSLTKLSVNKVVQRSFNEVLTEEFTVDELLVLGKALFQNTSLQAVSLAPADQINFKKIFDTSKLNLRIKHHLEPW